MRWSAIETQAASCGTASLSDGTLKVADPPLMDELPRTEFPSTRCFAVMIQPDYVGGMRKWPRQIGVWLAALVAGQAIPPARVCAADDPFAEARARMVEEQLLAPGRGITNAPVLAAMRAVPRHEFVPQPWRSSAYQDSALPIGDGQTISQPYIVAFMTEQLRPRPGDRVLEVGTGSGYQAAVLAELTAQVYTIEIIEELATRAAADLKRLGYTNVHVRAGDGYKG